MTGVAENQPDDIFLFTYNHLTLSLRTFFLTASAGTTLLTAMSQLNGDTVNQMVLATRHLRGGLYHHSVVAINMASSSIDYSYQMTSSADPENWPVGHRRDSQFYCFAGVSSDRHTIKIYRLVTTAHSQKVVTHTDPNASFQPLYTTCSSSTFIDILVMVDDSSFRYYHFRYDQANAYVNRWKKVVPVSATYSITGNWWRYHTPYGYNGQSLVYFGREMWHKKYPHLVSAFTFHDSKINCLDQTISNYVGGTEMNIATWTNSAVTRETSPTAYSVVNPGYSTVDVTSQIVYGDAPGAPDFVEPCTIEVEQDTSISRAFPLNQKGSFSLKKKCNEVSQCNEPLNLSYETDFDTWPSCLSYNEEEGEVEIDNCETVGDYSITFTCETLGVESRDIQKLTITEKEFGKGVNHPPIFTSEFTPQKLAYNEVMTIGLPGYEDQDILDKFQETVSLDGGKLSEWIQFSPHYDGSPSKLVVDPETVDKLGSYVISFSVTDSNSEGGQSVETIQGSFTLEVILPGEQSELQDEVDFEAFLLKRKPQLKDQYQLLKKQHKMEKFISNGTREFQQQIEQNKKQNKKMRQKYSFYLTTFITQTGYQLISSQLK